MTTPLVSHAKQRKPDKRDAYEHECLTKIVHCLREMQCLNHQKRAGSYAYRIMEAELSTWREALALYRKTNNIRNVRVR